MTISLALVKTKECKPGKDRQNFVISSPRSSSSLSKSNNSNLIMTVELNHDGNF